MTRRESLGVLGVAFVLITAGLTWLLGPYGLIIAGVGLAAAVLFGVNLEERRAQPVPDPGPAPWLRSEP